MRIQVEHILAVPEFNSAHKFEADCVEVVHENLGVIIEELGKMFPYEELDAEVHVPDDFPMKFKAIHDHEPLSASPALSASAVLDINIPAFAVSEDVTSKFYEAFGEFGNPGTPLRKVTIGYGISDDGNASSILLSTAATEKGLHCD